MKLKELQHSSHNVNLRPKAGIYWLQLHQKVASDRHEFMFAWIHQCLFLPFYNHEKDICRLFHILVKLPLTASKWK